MTEKQKRRMVMVDDDLWERVRRSAKEASLSASAWVRGAIDLALVADLGAPAAPTWEGPFPQGEAWVGFDLDGTLAHYEAGYAGEGVIGAPIDRMVDILQEHLKQGNNVAIVTARVSDPGLMPEVRFAIEDWCLKHIGRLLPVTCRKDFGMAVLYDDRVKQVTPNTGRLVEDYAMEGGTTEKGHSVFNEEG